MVRMKANMLGHLGPCRNRDFAFAEERPQLVETSQKMAPVLIRLQLAQRPQKMIPQMISPGITFGP